MELKFKFDFDQKVKVKVSGEIGTIDSVCQHKRTKETNYCVSYKAADGRAVDKWFYGDELEAVV